MQLNATSSPATATRSERVLGRLGFLRPTRDKPAIHIRPLGNGERSALPDEAYETRDVWVEDVRGRRGEFSLDREGVRFIDHRSSVTDWFDAEQLSERYYREAEDLIREATGARRVIVFDHTLRAMEKSSDHINTVVRQISFSNFERAIHTARRDGKLTLEQFNGEWMKVTKAFYGEEGDLFTYGDTENLWSYVSHFLRPFYVYAYAFGELFTQSLFSVQGQFGEEFEGMRPNGLTRLLPDFRPAARRVGHRS